MTHRSVEHLIGRLATDPALRRRFAEHPAVVLDEMQAEGLELTRVERAALETLDAKALQSFAAGIDRRIRRASPVHESGPGG
jgi:hypothetical protein